MTGPDTRILATGGASLNRAILQVRKDFTEKFRECLLIYIVKVDIFQVVQYECGCLRVFYERVKIIIRNPWPVSHTLTHSLPWASSFNFSISYEYLFIDSQLTNEEVKLFRYLYAHPYLYLV